MNITAQSTNAQQLEHKPSLGVNYRAPLGEAIESIVNELQITLSAWYAVDDPWNDESAGERGTLKLAITYLQWILVLLRNECPGLPEGLPSLKVTAPGRLEGGMEGLTRSAEALVAIASDIEPIAFALAVHLKNIAQSIQATLTDKEAGRLND